MKKNILEEIKDTDNKIKKVFDDFIEQRKRTSQLLQTSYEQLKTSSFNNNKSLNISREITLEGGRNDDSKDIKLTDYSPDLNLKSNQIFTQENDDQLYTQDNELIEDAHNKNEQNKFNISQDTEDLLKSQDDLDIEFPTSLRQFNNTQQFNNNSVQQPNNPLQNRRLSQNSLRTSMESLNDDSLLSSLHNNSIFNGSQVHQQQQQYSQNNFLHHNDQNKSHYILQSGNSKHNQKQLSSFLKIRESEIDFGKMFIFQSIQKSIEILNTSDKDIQLRIYFEQDQFELNSNIIAIPEFSSAKVIIKCYREDEQRIFDTLCIEEAVENESNNKINGDHITLLVKAQILKPQLVIKSDQNMYVSGQFTTIEAKLNELGEINIYLTNPLTELSQEIEIDVVQKQNDANKISFFPQNFILKQQETKKIAFTVSHKNTQNVQQVFCVFFKVNSSSLIFATKVSYC